MVEPLNMIRFAGQFADGSVLCGGNHPFIHHILIRIKGGVLTVRFRNLGLQARGTPTATVPHVKGNDLARCGIHRHPDPLLVGFLRHKAAHCIRCHLQALDHDVVRAGDRVDVEMIRQRLEAWDENPQ
jgi:hypothetical protein